VAMVRERVPALDADRPPAPDIAALEGLIISGGLSTVVAAPKSGE